ncbi:efflux RND transporter permease subunit [Methylotenera sp.]|uniref:efflux RND transporter permease subunit n=1 Tax=Methylotenera sp. TaxID=2051956 RepID=UPI002730038E|nr:efflux RND transporter permease subunit [Methylotenera sp.]MDP1521899.1 efflux RND transporter permease subunit [Methylotenera sp.]MDP2072127.1 efflux RND transporter permease subunit [Methylotenera sp.]MDP3006863.1 efflux RND transporter permease subunit [Methylotenera sp.]MDP3007200.1 efflux RND transporter permease subunit [Methylotenera sp.]
MISALVRFSIRFSGVIIGLAMIMVLYGLYTLNRSNLDVFPEFSPTQIIIQTESPGLSAELVESIVTQSIETSIAGTVGIESMRSQSIPGLSIVTIIFDESTDIYRNRQVIAERLATLNNKLPQGITPNITPLTSSASTVLGVGLTSKTRSLTEVRTLVDWVIVPHLLAIPGVADVNVFGGKVRQFQVQADPEKMIRYGISLIQIEDAVKKATGVRGNGYIENKNQRIVINTEGQATSPEKLAQVTLLHKNGQTIRLGDIGKVVEGAAPSISAAAINEETGVYLSVQGQLGANTHGVTLAIERALQELKPSLTAENVTLHEGLFRPANFIEVAIQGVRTDILIGSVLVIAILFLFLFNVRTAFISATAIPLSLLTAIVVMSYFNIGLNIMVLGGLAIALGEVVDDAIIDTENIFRRLRENRLLSQPIPTHRVVFNASMEVRSSVVYATIIVALVFLPLLTLGGVAGKLFAPLGFAYIAAILASLVVALTLTPALCYLLLGNAKLESEDPPMIRIIKKWYIKVLHRIEKQYKFIIAASFLVIAIGLGTLPLFKSQFIPALYEGHYIMHMTAVPGTSEQESLRIGKRVSALIRNIKGVKSVVQWVGRAPNGADSFGTHYSEFEIEVGAVSGEEQRRILNRIREELAGEEIDDDGDGIAEAGFIGVNFAINTFLTERIEETISGYAASTVINIYGQDLDALDRDANAIASVVKGIKGAKDVLVQSPPGTPQLVIRLRPEKMAQLGLQPTDVLDNIRAAHEGVPITQVYEGNRVIGVSVLLDLEARDDVQEAGSLPLFNPEGKLLRLRDVADIAQENGRSKILHAGAKRIQTVTANVSGRDIESFTDELKNTLKNDVVLSQGAYLEFTGAAEANAKSREALILQSLLAGVTVFLMLYIAFGRLRNLLLTFANLPFALFGGVLAIMATGGWISIGSLVGFVTLFGITLRNSIMMVSHYQHLVDEENCIWGLETCIRGASERLPSILMTALVTSLGLLPLAIASGQPGREIEGPMATIIVGGLITSTILNLLILPTIMLHFGRFEKDIQN